MARECYGTETESTCPKALFETKHYKLPQWQEGTPTSWLTQLNMAFRQIDELFHDMALRTAIDGLPDETVEEVVRLSNQVTEIETNLTANIKTVTNLGQLVSNINESLATVQTRLETITTNATALDTRMTAIESRMTALEARVNKIEKTYSGGGDTPSE